IDQSPRGGDIDKKGDNQKQHVRSIQPVGGPTKSGLFQLASSPNRKEQRCSSNRHRQGCVEIVRNLGERAAYALARTTASPIARVERIPAPVQLPPEPPKPGHSPKQQDGRYRQE